MTVDWIATYYVNYMSGGNYGDDGIKAIVA